MKKLQLMLFCLFILSCANIYTLSFFDDEDPSELARRLVLAMTDEQALAQTFMLRWVGAEPSPLIINWIRDRHIGGVKIFGWNTDNTRHLAQTVGVLQTHALNTPFSIPLFVATDQEGGWVRHVKGATSETPGNMAIGASGYPMDAYRSGFYIGRELALLGINMNFAPAVDLYTRQDSVLIGPRSFGADPVQAGILGAAFVRGLEAAGVIATAKHYPGHGDTDLDSHGVLPRIYVSFDTLWERELIPYRLMVREGLSAIMSGHLAFPNTRAGEVPASLSSWFLKDILRDRIGFQGLIITDDLLMNGATAFSGSLSRTARDALFAGNDVIMLSSTPNLFDPVWTLLVETMRNDPVFRNQVRESARRILETKLIYLKSEQAVLIPDPVKVEQELQDPEAAAFFLDLAARSVTVVRDTNSVGERVFPLAPDRAGRVLLAGRFTDFFNAGRRAFPNSTTFWLQGSSPVELARQAGNVDTVIFCLADADDLFFLRGLRNLGKRVIVFSILSPVHIEGALWADAALAVYSYAPESFVAGFSAILGRFPAEGRLPFSLGENGTLRETPAAPRN
jgi:beta-N-acetylhexosaminidase